MGTTQPFDVINRLLRRALADPDADASLELQVFRAQHVQGAIVAKFFPEALAESLHAVYVPPGIDEDGSIAERLHAAVATHEGLVEVTDRAEQRTLLRVLRAVLDRTEAANDDAPAPPPDPDAAPARVEFGPLEALEALDAAENGAGVVVDVRFEADDDEDAGDADPRDEDARDDDLDAAEHDRAPERNAAEPDDADADPGRDAGATDDDPADDYDTSHASFRAIALDVLSGLPAPHGSGPNVSESYEVWSYRHDPAATVVLRWFDAGDALVLGAVCPAGEDFDVERFAAAVYTLLATKFPDAVPGRVTGRLSDLEPLETSAAMERLGRALGLEHTRDVREITTELLGSPSEEALDAFESLRLLDPRAPLGPAAVLAELAESVLEHGVEVLWTKKKEREGAPRIELLEHRADAGALLLIDVGAADEAIEIAGFVPEDGLSREVFETDARRMLAARDAYSGRPTPLADDGPFRRVPNSRAIAAMEELLDALDRREGVALRLTDRRDP